MDRLLWITITRCFPRSAIFAQFQFCQLKEDLSYFQQLPNCHLLKLCVSFEQEGNFLFFIFNCLPEIAISNQELQLTLITSCFNFLRIKEVFTECLLQDFPSLGIVFVKITERLKNGDSIQKELIDFLIHPNFHQEHEEEERRELQKLLSQDKSEKDTKVATSTPKLNGIILIV